MAKWTPPFSSSSLLELLHIYNLRAQLRRNSMKKTTVCISEFCRSCNIKLNLQKSIMHTVWRQGDEFMRIFMSCSRFARTTKITIMTMVFPNDDPRQNGPPRYYNPRCIYCAFILQVKRSMGGQNEEGVSSENYRDGVILWLVTRNIIILLESFLFLSVTRTMSRSIITIARL